eukprot:TRINITY_DN8296_c1_g5_i1.p1 TRINITY_DN8296_c1_g5~~TRINITY_DN8296_c1_g5_i1.p1  ORF type:complete len:335 (+),score=13.67 TRINITY_DN8296_c1_g5_i1:45-1007(+)
MPSGTPELDRDATSNDFYPVTLFSDKMDRPPLELWLEPPAKISLAPLCTVRPTAESCISTPGFPDRMHGESDSHVNVHAWETKYKRGFRRIRAGQADKCLRISRTCGCGYILAVADLRNATYFRSQGSITEARSGRPDVAPESIPSVQHHEKDYNTHKRTGYPRANQKGRYRRGRHSRLCDRYGVPLNRGTGFDSREGGSVSQKDQMPAISESSYCPDEAIDELISGSLMSAGSVWHAGGRCIPCKFFRSKASCKSGLSCEFCHYPHKELSRSRLRSSSLREKSKNEEAIGPGVDSSSLPRISKLAGGNQETDDGQGAPQ